MKTRSSQAISIVDKVLHTVTPKPSKKIKTIIKNESSAKTTKSPEISSGINYFLIKAEPNSRMENNVDVKFSLDDLKSVNVEHWDGVRNYEARNIMRDQMKVNDLCFFYHSNTKSPGIAGVAKVVKSGYVDFTAFDSKHPYYDQKSKEDDPKWFMVDVEYVRHFKRFISLKEMQSHSELKEMPLIKRGRLSVQTVRKVDWDFIHVLEDLVIE